MSVSTLSKNYLKIGIYGIILDALLESKQALTSIKLILKSGLCALQYRDKRLLPFATKLALAKKIKTLCLHYNTPLIINDCLKLTKMIEADGIHLGQQDLQYSNLQQTRIALGYQKIIGVTVHSSLTLAKQAEYLGANYVSFGRCFTSHTKPNAPKTSLDIITQAKKLLKCQIVAIGGITVKNALSIYKAGADRLAVGHDLFLEKNCSANLQQLQYITNMQVQNV